MNTRLIPHLAWATAAAAAFAVGYLAEDRPPAVTANGSGGAPGGSASAADHRVAAPNGESLPHNQQSRADVDPEQARNRLFEILSEADAFARYRDLCEFIPSITKENWRGALEAFAVQRRTMGRRFTGNPELQMVAQRIGEVAGAEALKDYANPQSTNDVEIAGNLMVGWVRTDPTRASEWFQQLDAGQQQRLRGPLVEGVAWSDPAQALEIVFQGSADTQENGAGTVMAVVLEKSGFSAAEGLLARSEQRPDIPDATKGMMFLALAYRKLADAKEAGDPFAGLSWYEQYVGKSYMGPMSTSSVISAAVASDPGKTLNWLETNGDAMTAKQQEAAYSTLVGDWRKQGEDGFADWLTAHPDDPQHDHLAATAAGIDLGKGLLVESQRWLQMIADPQIQAPLAARAAEMQLQRDKLTKPK